MLTPDSLREHYGADEFAPYDDAHMQKALDRGAATVARYVPTQPVAGGLLEAVIEPVILTLARAYAHDELRYDEQHPVVREMKEAIRWLERVATGQIQLFADDSVPYPGRSSMAVGAPKPVFTDALFGRWL